MARVERGNVVLHKDDEDVQHYIKLGYKQTDEMGNVIQDTIPSDVGTLKKAYIDKDKKIAELEATIAKLTAEASSKPSKPKAETVAEPKAVAEDKPATSKAKKTQKK